MKWKKGGGEVVTVEAAAFELLQHLWRPSKAETRKPALVVFKVASKGGLIEKKSEIKSFFSDSVQKKSFPIVKSKTFFSFLFNLFDQSVF